MAAINASESPPESRACKTSTSAKVNKLLEPRLICECDPNSNLLQILQILKILKLPPPTLPPCCCPKYYNIEYLNICPTSYFRPLLIGQILKGNHPTNQLLPELLRSSQKKPKKVDICVKNRRKSECWLSIKKHS